MKNNIQKELLDLLKQIIEARVSEIIQLSVTQNNFFKNNISDDKPCMIFVGSGSKLLSNNFKIDFSKDFLELIFFEENDAKICEAGINEKKPKKTGFFERFFNLFSK